MTSEDIQKMNERVMEAITEANKYSTTEETQAFLDGVNYAQNKELEERGL